MRSLVWRSESVTNHASIIANALRGFSESLGTALRESESPQVKRPRF